MRWLGYVKAVAQFVEDLRALEILLFWAFVCLHLEVG